MKILKKFDFKIKTIVYFNQSFVVPEWVQYVATNYDGFIYGYEKSPRYVCPLSLDNNSYKWHNEACSDCIFMGKCDLENLNPKDTLVNVNSISASYLDIKIEDYFKTKEVNYFNNKLTVPEWVNYISIDDDGDLYGYEDKPILLSNHWNNSDLTRYVKIGSCDLGKTLLTSKNTLIRV